MPGALLPSSSIYGAPGKGKAPTALAVAASLLLNCGRFGLNEETVHVVSKLPTGWVPRPVCQSVTGTQGELPRRDGVCSGGDGARQPASGPRQEEAVVREEEALRPLHATAPAPHSGGLPSEHPAPPPFSFLPSFPGTVAVPPLQGSGDKCDVEAEP